MKAAFISCLICLLITGCGSSPNEPDPGQTTNLLNPADGDTVQGPQVACSWDAVTGATKYYHQIDSDPTMQSPQETVTTSPAAAVTPEQNGTWWWRVRASVSGQQTYTPWSEIWSFTLSPVATHQPH